MGKLTDSKISRKRWLGYKVEGFGRAKRNQFNSLFQIKKTTN